LHRVDEEPEQQNREARRTAKKEQTSKVERKL